MTKIIIGVVIGIVIVLSVIYRKQVKEGFNKVVSFGKKIVDKIKNRKNAK